MSREIDFDNLPLSDEDRQYLLDRGQEQLVHALENEDKDKVYSPYGAEVYDGVTGDVGFDKEDEGWRPTIVDTSPKPEPEPEPESEDDEVPPYSEWSNDDLRTELKARGLSADGKKAELVARLDDSDAAEADVVQE